MRQAIVTRYLGPTDHRGARIKARADAGTITIPWNHAQDIEANHTTAAETLATKLGWVGEHTDWQLVGGGLPDGTGNAYVLVRSTGRVES